jgi:hypothetical protein
MAKDHPAEANPPNQSARIGESAGRMRRRH